MKVLGINGSPRKGGNTDILLEEALKGAASSGAECEKIMLNDLHFSACQECARPPDNGNCVVDDDMQAVYKKVDMANVVIVASPVFFGSLSAQTKMMIDRFQCRWRAKYVTGFVNSTPPGKKGAFISVSAGDKKEYFDNAASIIKNFFATVGAVYTGELFCAGLENKGDVLKCSEIFNAVFKLGQKAVKN
ncbi:MAG: flavodoxin family protein [Candidatus Omnitrophica bacterium]|nr:flavodoxin family protein [Candidatus Omnitrophota bacterium]MBU1127907.1 flavodoxin family protein [Candidatus Omnitrophota bacterium]MBU1784591.1 flavodoxin family protein [Candidatus Omnitrophota bacterium]MBU1850914.1 flavodoxin family protein [Candidatus Omnitrophota bacterium]